MVKKSNSKANTRESVKPKKAKENEVPKRMRRKINLKDMSALTEMVLFDLNDSESKLSYLRLANAQERFRISKKHKPEREYII